MYVCLILLNLISSLLRLFYCSFYTQWEFQEKSLNSLYYLAERGCLVCSYCDHIYWCSGCAKVVFINHLLCYQKVADIILAHVTAHLIYGGHNIPFVRKFIHYKAHVWWSFSLHSNMSVVHKLRVRFRTRIGM